MSAYIEIAGRRIGPGSPVYVIAELSANHGQDYAQALELVHAAKACGADAVKLQTYTADTLTLDCDNEWFRIHGTLWHGRKLYELYQEAFTPWEWQPKLKRAADDIGIALFSTPFDLSAVEFLEAMQVPAHKIASFENGDIALLQQVAKTGKPVIASTGMASLAEIDELVQTLRRPARPGGAVEMHQRLSGAARRYESAHHRPSGRCVRRAGGFIRPYARYDGGGGGGKSGRLHHRKTFHALARTFRTGQRVFARTRGNSKAWSTPSESLKKPLGGFTTA